jgi:starch synthase
MKILFVTPETAPFAKVGGLADVSRFLPAALAARGHQVQVVTPYYLVSQTEALNVTRLPQTFEVPVSWKRHHTEILKTEGEGGVEVLFVNCAELFAREGIYGNSFGDYEDNAERFIYFSRAAIELCLALDLEPDVIHAHDWPGGLIPVYLKTLYRDAPALENTASVFTVHNISSQGLFWHFDMPLTGLGWDLFHSEAMEFFGKINLLKAGLVFADKITTVSPTYAAEILTPELGFGLEGVIRSRQSDLVPVLNGVDPRIWDPADDPHLSCAFSAANPGGKDACREQLRQTFKLDPAAGPLTVAFITRLVERKGLDILQEALDEILALPISLVIMGHGPDKYQTWLHDQARKHPGRLGVQIPYQESLAHQIIAGSDALLMPSRFEPCGLEQLYALRYGTLPIARDTGGLKDTITDLDSDPDKGTGLLFKDYSASALIQALQRAWGLFQDRPRWEQAMVRAMGQNFSWDLAAQQYEQVYASAQAVPRRH